MKNIAAHSKVIENIVRRAHYFATQMIYQANHRKDKQKGDPKVGGHASGSTSCIHIMGALHLVVKSGFDYIVNKPHASPTDHAYNYLLDLLLKSDLSRLSLDEANHAMMSLRAFSEEGQKVFQSYHSALDPDHHNFLPTGTVGIPAVNLGYLALAYRFAKDHGYEVPDAHFWALCGDSEFREGSLYEAIPDFAERELNNLTWIIDYNRQSLDGHRITNRRIMNGADNLRIEKTMRANGWDVIQLQHGNLRKELFKRPGGDDFKYFLENLLEDYQLQALLLVKDIAGVRKGLLDFHPPCKTFFDNVTDKELFAAIRDLGGHDIISLVQAMEESKKSSRPTMIIVHTIKGWGLQMANAPGNHSALPSAKEMEELQSAQGLSPENLFARFSEASEEGQFLRQRGNELYEQIRSQNALKDKNSKLFLSKAASAGSIPDSLDIDLKMTSYPHTQWMLGQLAAKLTRIANTPLDEKQFKAGQKALTESEKAWKIPSQVFVSMAPDVGTSTNLNPAMDGKIFGVPVVVDYETDLGVKDAKTPDLVPGEDDSDRYIRFEISESNVMSCVGAFGKMRDFIGVPLMPLMTVYDFFIKRALDQYHYNMYWRSSFILAGTPSGVTLSPEGAQHGWKSDIQIPSQITWEPFFCQELDWIFCDSFRRHFYYDNKERNGVVIRAVTRGIEQKDFMKYLKRQHRFKSSLNIDQKICLADFPMTDAILENDVAPIDESAILQKIKEEVLAGAYFLIDYRGYAGYEPGDNVVNIFSLGSPTTEAISASNQLLSQGIYANVIVVTSTDLLLGNLGHQNEYHHLQNVLMIKSNIPIVSVHDGEPGLLDNIGSIVGCQQVCLAVRKHTRCGKPSEVYHFHGIDDSAVVQGCLKAMELNSR